MSLRITFELGNSDLNHFRTIMREAREAAVEHSPDEILQAAHGLLESVKGVEMPDFIRGRLEKITTMIEMVEDAEWKLPEEETARVLNALEAKSPYGGLPLQRAGGSDSGPRSRSRVPRRRNHGRTRLP